LLAIACERVIADETHMQFTTEAMMLCYCYILAFMTGCIGLRLGSDSRLAYRLLDRAALGIAWIAIPIFVLGDPPTPMPFPAPYAGFPMRLFTLFGFCWYLHAWMNEGNLVSRRLLGLAACSFPVLVAFHKPVILAATFSILSITLLQWRQGQGVRATIRLLLVACISVALFIGADVASDGEISSHYQEVFIRKYLHYDTESMGKGQYSDVIESASGGRFLIWEICWQRFKSNPIFGTGLGQVIQLNEWGERWEIPVHNLYLDMLLSVGVFGCIPVCLGAVLFLKRALKRISGSDAQWVIPVLAYVAGIAAFNMAGDTNLYWFQTAFLVFLMGMAAARVAFRPGSRRGQRCVAPFHQGLFADTRFQRECAS
jgi:O-antigen ligase